MAGERSQARALFAVGSVARCSPATIYDSTARYDSMNDDSRDAPLRLTPSSPALEREGVWTEYCGAQLRIARSTLPEFVDAIEGAPEDKEGRRRAFVDAMAKHILVDWQWEGVEYSEANARRLLTDDTDARNFVSRFSMKVSNYVAERTERLAGN